MGELPTVSLQEILAAYNSSRINPIRGFFWRAGTLSGCPMTAIAVATKEISIEETEMSHKIRLWGEKKYGIDYFYGFVYGLNNISDSENLTEIHRKGLSDGKIVGDAIFENNN